MYKNLFSFLAIFYLIQGNAQIASPYNMATISNTSKSTISQVWYAPLDDVGKVGKFNKLEVGFNLGKAIERDVKRYVRTKKTTGINPFNPKEINMGVILTSPSGKKIKTNGFYYQPFFEDTKSNIWVKDTTSFHWRLRFSPNEIGKWQVKIVATTKNHPVQESSFHFECVTSNHKGILMTSKTGTKADRYLYLSETGETFIPIGHNISTRGQNITPSKNDLHKKWIKELGNNGGNFFRMEMPAGGALPDWPIYNDYTDKLGKMYGYDEVVDLAETLEMYFIMFRHHVEVGAQASWGVNWDCWTNNPYKKAFNLTTSESYFTNEEIIKFQKNTLQYIMARWGYSPSFAFYGYSEVDNWTIEMGLEPEKAVDLFADWVIDGNNFINESTHFLGGMYVNSFTSNMPLSRVSKSKKASRLIDASDIIAIHTYNNVKWANYRTRYDFIQEYSKEWDYEKPIIIEEIGLQMQDIYCCTGIDFHNNIWSNTFMGAMGTSMHWSWDRGIHDMGYYTDYNNLNAFFKGENLRKGNYTPQRWKNGGGKDMKKTTIENFCLVSENKEKVLGWVHNAAFYWRNMKNTNDCMQELIDSGKVSNPCELEDGSTPLASKVNTFSNYNNPKFLDAYADKEGAFELLEGELLKIKKLKKSSLFKKKEWYKVSYYPTHGGIPMAVFSKKASTSLLGKLKLPTPLLDENNPDYSYKIEYLGR